MEYSNRKYVIALPHLKCGGTERTAAELANYIAQQGGNVTIVLMYKKDVFYEIHPNVQIFEPNFSTNKTGRFFYIFFLLYYLRSQFRQLKPDVIFAIGYIAYSLFSSLGLKTKVVISLRSSPSRIRFPNNQLLNSMYKLSHKIMRTRVNGVIAQTKRAEEVYKKRYSCPVIVIPNFLRSMKEYQAERENLIINVGHCAFEKGQQYLITAFAKLKAPDWKLIIVGDGPKRNELERLSGNLGVKDRVIFTGYQKDVDLFLSKSKIFAFTSIIEGYPNALIEAMATPLPPVSFDCEAGPSDIISNGENGYLVKTGDVDAFAQRLQQLIDNPALREKIQKNAYSIKHNNDLCRIADLYLSFFNEIAKN